VAIQCPHCGTILPTDDARFCNHCGTSVPVLPSLQQAPLEAIPDNAASLQEPSSTTDQKKRRSAPREQIAQQPFSLTSQFSGQNEPPAWIKNLGTVNTSEKRSPETAMQQPSLAQQDVPALSSPPETSPPQDAVLQDDLATSITPHRSQFAGRELRVKVWNQDDTLLQSPSEDAPSLQPDVVEDLPTRPTISAVSPELQDAAVRPVPVPQNQSRDQIEMLDTAQIATYGQAQQVPDTPLPIADQSTRIEKTPPIKEDFVPPSVSPAAPSSLPPQQISGPQYTPFLGLGDVPSGPPMQERRPAVQPVAPAGPPTQDRQPFVQSAAPAALSAPSTSTAQPRKSRYPLIAFLILVPVVLVSALGIWIVQARPFSVSPVTQPWQQFQDQKLGVSLLYPNGWQVQVDDAKSTIHFSDSSNTAQVNIAVTSATGGDLAQYLSQQAKQLQITGTKSATTLTFAHSSWTQIQGTTQESGANYNATLLATVHNNHVFTITLLAPSSNYASQEEVNFSYMRNSWQFL
jgi:hypothetical protein